MAAKTKAQCKTVSFDDSEADQQLLEAIAAELKASHFRSFGELCKAALHQYLLEREPAQPLVLLMELQRQLATLQSRVDVLEAQGPPSSELPYSEHHVSEQNGAVTEKDTVPEAVEKDPVLEHLGALLDDF